MAPPEGVEGTLWLSGLARDELQSMHQWQRDRTETTPNHCAVTAMVTHQARLQPKDLPGLIRTIGKDVPPPHGGGYPNGRGDAGPF